VRFSDGHSLSEYVYTGPGPTELSGELSTYTQSSDVPSRDQEV
jgi:hypothetical protein